MDKTVSRQFMEWLLEKVDDPDDDVEVSWPAGFETNAEVLDIRVNGYFFSVSVNHTHPPGTIISETAP